MASGGTELSTRVSAEDENIENKHINDIALTYFKKYKVEISSTITTTFPFLELLRDRGFITNEMYKKSQESFKKQFSVHEVIYDILSELEKKFDMSVLRALFSKIIVKKYPDLYRIYKIFYKVIPDIKSFLESDGEENEERLNDQLSLEQGTGGNSYQRPIWLGPDARNYNGAALPEHGLSEHCCETQEINMNETGTTTDNNNALENQQGNEKCAQESEQEGAELLHHGNKTSSCSVDLVDRNKKMPFLYSGVECEAQARTGCNQASDVIEINSEDSRESSDGGEPPEASTSALKRESGTVDFGNNSISEKVKKRRMRSRGRDSMQSLNNRVPRKRSKTKGTKAVNTGPLKRSRKRGPRIPRDKHMNFKRSILPVTCGPAKGKLYKEKMKQGISAKCIKTKNGKQLTLREFEIEGNHERSKNWKLSVRCGGYPLKCLIKKGFLPDPPRTRKRVPDSHSDNIIDPYPENSNICKMCRKGGTLFCCDTCPRSFHDSCHIRHIDPDRDPWSCIFCEIKIILKRCPESQPCHQESEILERKMLHEEHLKCEFLLLKVCHWSKSSFFMPKPYYSKKRSQSLTKCMWLNKIREKLASKLYLQVKDFVQDMRLIFQNHRKIYEGQKFIMLGIQIEAKFEKNFKDIFGIQ